MVCKCTALGCNPCTNPTRISDVCPECFILGHVRLQTKRVTSNQVGFKQN